MSWVKHQVLFHPKVCSVVSELVQLCESAGCQPTCSLQQDRFCILQGGSTVLVWDACDPGQPPVELDCGSSMVNTGTIVMVPTRTAAEWGVVVFWRHLGGKLRYWRQWLRSEEYVDCTLDFDETMDQSPSCAIPLPFGGVLLGFTEGAVAQVTLPFLQRGSSTTPTARLGKRPASFLKVPWQNDLSLSPSSLCMVACCPLLCSCASFVVVFCFVFLHPPPPCVRVSCFRLLVDCCSFYLLRLCFLVLFTVPVVFRVFFVSF